MIATLFLAGPALAGCQTTGVPDTGMTQARPQARVASITAPKPGGVAGVGLDEVMALDQTDITSRFGRPALARREGRSVFWRYSDNRCALILYFPAGNTTDPRGARPSHGVIRWFASHSAATADADCLAGFDRSNLAAQFSPTGI
ncbi:hypothetical protein GCM10011505_45500 [Tistrella bauzanensis]|uniref:Lipoprotein n=1 Tax=Tistrella bauzanensis TaxID=657419 RepID=A0ABQ1J633_9PROT|nr:hypothetical protein [Tistrella bauzanensis]GGB59654.1 hypothetical protein GCM10011505_45500 [Tistrella bauzanensis]